MEKFKPIIIETEDKINGNILPFLSMPIIAKCNFKCHYCGEGGELTASYVSEASFDFIKNSFLAGYQIGIRKFRLTGGEPFFHKDFQKMVEFISNYDDVFLLINTNGSQVLINKLWVQRLKSNVKFAVSLDTLSDVKFDFITKSKMEFNKVIQGIQILDENKNLYRINTVVHKENFDEIPDIIEFCSKKGYNIKLLEVCSVPIPYNHSWDKIYISLKPLCDWLSLNCENLTAHHYSKSFGIPMPVYKVNGITVTVKTTIFGTRYDIAGICKNCTYFPCHEGVYDLYLLPDGRLCGCRWSETSVAEGKDLIEKLKFLSNSFQNAIWIKSIDIKKMDSYPVFVSHKLKNI